MAKIRAIVNGVSFYTNTSALKNRTSGCHTLQNTALYYALDKMGKSLGVATTVALYDTNLKRYSFDVQLCVM